MEEPIQYDQREYKDLDITIHGFKGKNAYVNMIWYRKVDYEKC